MTVRTSSDLENSLVSVERIKEYLDLPNEVTNNAICEFKKSYYDRLLQLFMTTDQILNGQKMVPFNLMNMLHAIVLDLILF